MGKEAEGRDAGGTFRRALNVAMQAPWAGRRPRTPGSLFPGCTHPALQRSRARPCSAAAGRGLVAAAAAACLFPAAASGHLPGGLKRLVDLALERKPGTSRREGSEGVQELTTASFVSYRGGRSWREDLGSCFMLCRSGGGDQGRDG